ncbi:LysR family transcriptional regulator [Pokkaliibacter plantistimulans]|uniref:LysR family transcriptional regulator n=1 Tax=Pokkaliibacter plantistimulans TaxID=1635171 RepID=UPI000D740A72|nr:LysR family transcriptional regulator [Pokkaliibacter plantistimulans]
MDKLLALKMFLATVEAGGFSAAARRLDLATSSVTRMVSALEQDLGTVLLNRSTRQVTVTEAGEVYYQQARRILDELADADEQVRDSGSEPSGPLRVSLPTTLGRDVIAPHLGEFIRRYPRLELDITVSDSISDLLGDSIDLAIRLGAPAPMDGVVSRTISGYQRWVVASPAYLAAHGEPRQPADLLDHRCLRFNYVNANSRDLRQVWTFRRQQEEQRIAVNGSYRSNNAEILRAAVLADAGIVLISDWLVSADVAAGRLQRLFADYEVNPNNARSQVSALYLPNQRGSLRINAFIDFFITALQRLRQQIEPYQAAELYQTADPYQTAEK